MPSRGYAPLLVLVLATAGPSAAEGPEAAPREREETAAESEVRRKALEEFHSRIGPRREQIDADLKAGPHEPWEGAFSNGAPFRGLDRGCIISRKHGYVSTSRRVDMGVVKAKEDRIALYSEAPFNAWGLIPREYVVPWDGQVFLVEPDELVSFCNDVNSGKLRHETPFASYLLRVADFAKPRPTGMPRIPAEYKDYLLKTPIAGTVTRVGEDKEDVAVRGGRWLYSGTSLTLSVGKKDGVRAGMRFYPERDPEAALGLSFFVISLAERQCELLQCGSGRKDRAEVGLRLTTADLCYDRK
jgi:hypothetical protein